MGRKRSSRIVFKFLLSSISMLSDINSLTIEDEGLQKAYDIFKERPYGIVKTGLQTTNRIANNFNRKYRILGLEISPEDMELFLENRT